MSPSRYIWSPDDLVFNGPVDDETHRAALAVVERNLTKAYNPDQPRDDHGMWTSGGGGGGGDAGRPLVEARTMFGEKYPEGKTVYAVEAADGHQVHAYLADNLRPEETPSAEEVRTALSAVADMHDRYAADLMHSPEPPSLSIVSHDTARTETGGEAGGKAYVGASFPQSIQLVGRDWTSGIEGGMPSAADTSGARYVATHEYGHWAEAYGPVSAVGADPGMAMQQPSTYFPEAAVSGTPGVSIVSVPSAGAMAAAVEEQPGNGGMSAYGMTNPSEAYAEAFAEYNLTNGTTTNFAAQSFAQAYHWHT